VLKLAHAAGVPVRIAHSHNDTCRTDSRASFVRRAYLRLAERWIRRYATVQLACSRDAAYALFGEGWREGPKARVLHCGIDLQPFGGVVDRAAIRAELGIPRDALVLGNVGRFHEQKNHQFLLEIMAETASREPRAVLLLVGDGALRGQIEARAAALGLRDRVVFAGVRADVHRMMLGAMDVFVFPSRYEGLGVVLIEAQAAGLPCVISDVVPREADVSRRLIRRLDLSLSAGDWATAVLQSCGASSAIARTESLAMLEGSSFDIRVSTRALEQLYCAEQEVIGGPLTRAA
jgi:glycosyltransferase involved in cell wall biosynthesis